MHFGDAVPTVVMRVEAGRWLLSGDASVCSCHRSLEASSAGTRDGRDVYGAAGKVPPSAWWLLELCVGHIQMSPRGQVTKLESWASLACYLCDLCCQILLYGCAQLAEIALSRLRSLLEMCRARVPPSASPCRAVSSHGRLTLMLSVSCLPGKYGPPCETCWIRWRRGSVSIHIPASNTQCHLREAVGESPVYSEGVDVQKP